MKRITPNSLIGCFLVLSFQLLQAQTNWLFYNTTNSGLPDNQVEAISIDSNNVKWIGTANGLARFDGSTWTVFDSSNSGLPSSHILSIEANGIGGVWVGTYDGVAIFDGADWILHNTGNNSAFANNTIVQILYDGINDAMWVGTEHGIVKYDGADWTLYNDSTSPLGDPIVHSLAVDNNGILYVGTFDFFNFVGRLFRFDGANWTNIRVDQQGIPGGRPESLAIDANNVIWMGVSSTAAGSNFVKITGSTWEPFPDSISPWLPNSGGNVLIEDHLKWFGAGQGLIVYNDTVFNGFNTANSDLPENTILSLALDHHRNKWIGTLSAGVAVLLIDSLTSTRNAADSPEFLLRITPNPVTTTATLTFNARAHAPVTIRIYNRLGEEVKIIESLASAGSESVSLDVADLPGGMYFCNLTCGSKHVTKKFLLLK